MSYEVESEFTHNDYKCVVIIHGMGHRCGYVGIPKSHPLYGIEYSQKTEEGISPEMYFNVHGGLTYSGNGDSGYPVKSDLWWFGYDCAHWNDAKDINLIKDPKLKEFEIEMSKRFPNLGVIRTKEYCEQECRNLSDQLKTIEEKL